MSLLGKLKKLERTLTGGAKKRHHKKGHRHHGKRTKSGRFTKR